MKAVFAGPQGLAICYFCSSALFPYRDRQPDFWGLLSLCFRELSG